MSGDHMGPSVLLIRHAERFALPHGMPGGDVELTEAGRAAARALGVALAGRVANVVTSPIPRCVDTAACVLAGAGGGRSLNTSTVLGDPGPFVIEPEIAWQAWIELGYDEVLARLIAGRVDRPGFRDRSRGVAMVTSLIRETLAALNGDQVAVLVTHDAVLGPAAACWFGDRPQLQYAPEFLEAATCWTSNGALLVDWRGNSAEIRSAAM